MILLIGLLFTIVFTFMVGLLCGGVAWFIDFPSLLVITFPLVFFLCASKSGRGIGGYIKTSFQKGHEYDTAELELITSAAKNTVKATLAAGWFGFFAGLIAMLANIDDPLQLTRGLSVSLISLYYAIAIGYFMFFPVQAWAENKKGH